MKTIIAIIVITLITSAGRAFAHGDGHGVIKPERALSIAQAATKASTFKDKGFSVGKIDTSWNKVKKDQYKIVENDSSGFIIKVTNPSVKRTLFIRLRGSGKVVDVKDQGDFLMTHGHDH